MLRSSWGSALVIGFWWFDEQLIVWALAGALMAALIECGKSLAQRLSWSAGFRK